MCILVALHTLLPVRSNLYDPGTRVPGGGRGDRSVPRHRERRRAPTLNSITYPTPTLFVSTRDTMGHKQASTRTRDGLRCMWGGQDSNLRPEDYESPALTD